MDLTSDPRHASLNRSLDEGSGDGVRGQCQGQGTSGEINVNDG